jgi:Protein of unknown function (DUF2510)
VLHLSGEEWVVAIVIAVVGAIVGYRLSESDRRNLGRTPWGLPSLVWALFWCLSLVLGLVLYLIAHSSEVRRAQHRSTAPFPHPANAPVSGGSSHARALSVAEQFPAYPQPANVHADRTESGSTDEDDRVEGAAAAEPLQTEPAPTFGHSPPAWHADPSGRFHYRWWDGTQWTAHVSTDGHHLVDTNPDQRIGPY